MLALPYRVLGARGYGILAGALVVNGAAVACVGVVLWRRGRTVGLMLGLVLVLVLARALGAGFLVDPWNPYVIVFPLLAVVTLAWAAADGDLWALPIAVGLGSFVVQSHVGAALAVVAPIGVSVGAIVLDARLRRGVRVEWVALVSTAVAVVCWLPPVVQQFQTGGGNLGDLLRFWTESHPNTTGWSAGARHRLSATRDSCAVVLGTRAHRGRDRRGGTALERARSADPAHCRGNRRGAQARPAVDCTRRGGIRGRIGRRVLGGAHRGRTVLLHRALDVDGGRDRLAGDPVDLLARAPAPN